MRQITQPIRIDSELSQDASDEGHEDQFAIRSSARPIPLPTELPPPPDLSRLPSHIVHSGTVETLIGQNDDLMARLKVNIRRNSVLEQQIMEHERVNAEIMRANSALLSQIQVLQEKDGIWKDKSQRSDQQGHALREEIQLLKTRLVAAETHARELKPAASYQRRIRKWVIPFIDRLKLELKNERETVFAKEALISDLRARLSESVLHAQNIESQISRDHARLVSQYEQNQKLMMTELEKLRQESKLARDKAARMDQAVATATTAENRIVLLERQNQELQIHSQKHRIEAQTLAQEAKHLMKDLEAARTDRQNDQLALVRLQEQFETLQKVWVESEKRLEAARTQHDNLNRLNQELSRQLRDGRKPDLEASC